jgi:outer membrane protein OmpA-like peptidoglycan-associated protein
VIVTYDVDTITLTGFVPSQAAKDRLADLAIANSKTDAQLENNLVINPAVPIGVGVRVIELNSVRFPQGSSEILPEHATELERVARVMQALPNVTVLVIGHADQRGDEAENFELSAARAEAVVEFLTYYGVSPTRLSSRAVGEADLLTLDDDDTALALNRRTEFIFYGLLIE